MHYYYKTQVAFDFPGLTTPAVGTIIPYLSESSVSDPIENISPADIRFTPVWPDDVPVLEVAETLGLAKNGLPTVRGQTSLQVLYEQSRANADTRSAKLIDPTREKVFRFEQRHLDAMGQIVTSGYRGKLYFPQLPPHLSERLFYDPNRGDLGALVFTGEFVDEILGEDYYLLNVMSGQEMLDVKNLAEGNADWAEAIDGLRTTLETFVESSPGSGVFDAIVGREEIGISTVAEIIDSDIAVDSYAISAAGGGTGYAVIVVADGGAFSPPGEPVSMEVFKVVPRLYGGELKVIASANPLDEKLTLQHSGDFGGDPADYEFAWITGQPVSGFPPETAVGNLSLWQEVTGGATADMGEDGKVRHTIEGASILTLTDNYFAMRYRAKAGTTAALATGGDPNNPGDWSSWTKPQLAEGWIKRALGGINPFEQRVTDLFSNEVNTSVSMISQAGPRWEGNISLNLENIDDFGLIEIYETILRRGIGLSIDGAPPLNVPAANDALLLAAGYLNDLYMLLGNEAFADAANPTIAFSSDSGEFGTSAQFGELSTALFAFKGQVATVLDEEL
ncbi:MAG: hypothetical protein P8J87_12995, partial [Verrucomicrobiales bacterium]|nr:hypothetical protein [Verrucomicrobiales bacterium]